MLQRVQSLYLGAVGISMAIFLGVSTWIKVSLDNAFSFVLTPYSLASSTGQHIIFPYSLSFLLASCIILIAAYAIIQHNNRKLQLCLIFGINLTIIILVILIFLLIKRADTAYPWDGLSTYKIGIIFPFMALTASLLAQHHIKNDEKRINEASLR